ncbi:hypothetical protein Tco_1484213 [Tanacetum coccineum]
METQKPLLKDEDGEEVDVHLYRSMIGSLMYLTSSRPDIMFALCACVRYQVNPKVSHLHAVKRIFRYLKGQPKLGLWYPKDSPFDFVAYTDSDYAGASLDRKSTTGGCQFLGDSNEKKLIQMIKIHTDKNVVDLLTKAFDKGIGVNAGDSKLMLLGINLLLLGKVNAARHNLLLLVIVDFLNASSIRYALTVNPTIYTSRKWLMGEVQLQALVDGKKIVVTEASVRRDLQLEDAEGVHCLPNATIFEQLTIMGKQKSRRPKEKDTEFSQSSVPSDPTNIADEAVNEEPTQEITSLKKRVKKLEKKGGSRTHKLKRLYMVGRSARVVSSEEESLGDQEDASKQGRIDDIDADKDIYLVNVHRDEDMFGVNDLEGDEVVVESEVADKDVNLSVDEVTLAQALATLKSAKVQEKGDVKDKGKGKMVEEEPVKKNSKKELLKLDEELAFKLQAEEDEEERLAREKA